MTSIVLVAVGVGNEGDGVSMGRGLGVTEQSDVTLLESVAPPPQLFHRFLKCCWSDAEEQGWDGGRGSGGLTSFVLFSGRLGTGTSTFSTLICRFSKRSQCRVAPETGRL